MTGDFSVEAQALKSLSDRSPYDAEELLSRLTTLPASVAVHLSRQSDGRRKFKKSGSGHGGDLSAKSSSAKPSKGSAPAGVWAAIEEFFRPITAEDIRSLIRDLSPNDPCFSIPGVETTVSETWAEKGLSFDGDGEVKVEVEAKKVEEVEKKAAEEEKVKEEEKNKVEEEKNKAEEQAMETTSCSLEVQEVQEVEEEEGEGEQEEEEEGEGKGMSWLLGSKHRVILTTQRPTKKRKLLGTDAGLDQLLYLPHSQEESSSPRCDICCLGESVAVKSKNRIVSCTSCSVCFHRNCYGLSGIREDTSVVCSWCKHLCVKGHNKEGGEDTESSKRPCVLCPRAGGALKPVEGNSEGGVDEKFAHLFCGMWTPEVYVEDTVVMEPVMNVRGVQETKTKLVCNVCKVKHGVCVRCSYGTCRTAFHPICAREARHRMEIWGKFGCDNVELRAFCAKHSTSQDIGSAQHSASLARNVSDDSSVAKPPTAPLLMNKLPKLRLSRKNKDKNTTQPEVTDAVSGEVVKNRKNFEQDAVALSCSPEDGDVQSNKNTATRVSESDKNLPNASNLIQLFKKLIDRGKIIIGDVAPEMGIPSDTLEEALSGDTSSLSSELRLNITKWLSNSMHMPATMRDLKSRNGSATSSGHVKFEDPDNVNDCPVKSLPPRRRTKSNIRILKEDDKVSSSGEILQQSCNGELVNELSKESKDSVSQIDDVKEDAAGNLSPTHHGDHCCEREAPLELVAGETCVSTDSDPCQNPDSELKRNSTKVESNDLSKTQCQPHQKEEHVSVKHANGHADEANIQSDDTIKKEGLDYRDGNTAVLVSATADHSVDGSCSGSCIHPYIKKRLTQLQRDALLQQKSREADSNVNQVVSHTSSDMDPMLDVAPLDQLAKAGKTGILELSPEDEVQGEMLYLQNRLVDNAVAIKHSCEDLLGKIVQKLPLELNALKKQQWDLVLVNQYLREVREAKKRGRKERKHREAQAVLAAAAAAAAASSRNPLLRKDSNDENPLNTSTAGRASGHSPLGPRLKETPRSSVVKVSPEKHSGIFQIPEFSKENELSCEICRRPETLLNRIFVCSSCKVAVHLDCYRKLKDPIGPWKCELCEEISQSGSPRNIVAKCWLCGGGSGAFRKSTNGQWVHAFCAEWILESTFRRGQLNHVDGMDAVSKEKDLLTCALCLQKFGVCTKCSYGNCQITFHPLCARTAGLYMNVKTFGGKLHHKAYCEKHSLEQRQKADNQQYGAEELKNIKQIRVELEKLRLLCERIIKREKVKRDLVICSHDILASRRDYVAFSVLVRSSFPLGVSSESATTSIDNKSYSGTMQRSEDITMDSTVSGKHNVKISIDMDRKTDDSSTSRPFKRKIADRTSFSGKQLPQRATSVPVQNLADDLERRFKPRKYAESFHKEVVMTSHQASMQNQRLPKGFAYVPVGYLSKENPVIHDSESHEPQEPGG